MIRKTRTIILLISIFSLALLAACGGKETSSGNKLKGTTGDSKGSEETIVLKYASTSPETHDIHVYGSNIFIDKVDELSNGRVKIEFYPNEQLGKGADMLNLANSGAVDMIMAAPSYLPGKLPLGNAFQLPGTLPDAEIGSNVVWDIIKDENSAIHKTDYANNGIRPLFASVLPLYQILTTGKNPIASLEDLKGLKLRSGGGVQDILVENLGAVPVAMETSEQYTALERGTLDGGIFNLPSLESNKTIEVLKYLTTNANVTSFVVSMAIGEKSWNKLSHDIQNILIEAGEAAAKSLAESANASNEKALQNALDKGFKAWTLTPDELKKLNELVAPTKDQWISNMEKLGFDGQAAIDEINEALKKYE
ncbi:TRAP transporter substrate-binding protein DctP [Neobacillus niacini]|uniref:TRAP transporter substrate-binding protein n=1 Tax=Neobacillus niacini TaxID=86668 RepID=UPI003000D835